MLLRLGAVLGLDPSVRWFANSGPLLRDHIQLPMGETLIATAVAHWAPTPEVRVYRPVRGAIDLVLDHRMEADTVATELQSRLLRVEQQVRWHQQKADALMSLPEYAERRVSRLLVLRNTQAIRDAVRIGGWHARGGVSRPPRRTRSPPCEAKGHGRARRSRG